MTFTITIPVWVFWTVGGLALVPVIYLMVLGVMFIKFWGGTNAK